jgi:hypothetical protein
VIGDAPIEIARIPAHGLALAVGVSRHTDAPGAVRIGAELPFQPACGNGLILLWEEPDIAVAQF